LAFEVVQGGGADHGEAASEVGADVADDRWSGVDRDPEPWPVVVAAGEVVGDDRGAAAAQ
jgi:hypothetical protein